MLVFLVAGALFRLLYHYAGVNRVYWYRLDENFGVGFVSSYDAM